jgi:hypothetical protein
MLFWSSPGDCAVQTQTNATKHYFKLGWRCAVEQKVRPPQTPFHPIAKRFAPFEFRDRSELGNLEVLQSICFACFRMDWSYRRQQCTTLPRTGGRLYSDNEIGAESG